MKFILLSVVFICYIGTVLSQKIGTGVTDVEGNNYKTVIIGNQEWMAQNLKTTRYNDQTEIPYVDSNHLWEGLTNSPGWCYYDNNIENNSKFGKLYNWNAINPTTNGNKNICPNGWHIPSDEDWRILVDYLGGTNIAGGKMKEVGNAVWNSPNESASNSSSFSGVPGGFRTPNGFFNELGNQGNWWSSTLSTMNVDIYAWAYSLSYTDSIALRNYIDKMSGLSVRCINNTPIGAKINELKCDSIKITGNLIQGIRAEDVTVSIPYLTDFPWLFQKQVLLPKVILNTDVVGLEATINDGVLSNGAGRISFDVSGIPNGYGTVFFDVNFLGKSCKIEIPVLQVKGKNGFGVTDIDGNQYQTVIIGGQEWMKENLKTSKYNDGSSIPNVKDSASWVSLATGAWVHYNNDEKFNSIYGKLYNGFVIRKDKNVCPSGWHIPKALEWKELVDFLGGDEIAGEKLKEVDTLLWYSPYEASKMDIQTTLPTNTSLFSARPGGVVYNRWGFDGMRWSGFWWGADPQFSNDTNIAYLVVMNHSDNSVQHADKNKKNGFSIRCLKDQVEGSVNSIDCEKKSINGAILEQTEVSNVTIELPYFGGNGGNINQMVINSSGIEGLVATLNKGFLKEGDSTLTFTISGKTTSYGVAVFDLNFSGQTCKAEVTVEQILGKYGAGVADVEGNKYKTVIIGNQEWMGENLKTTKYNDGQIIRNLVENDLWQTDSIGGWCNYQNDQSFDEIYGKLYNWHVINPKFKKNVCPIGWHVPTVKDWGNLIQYLGDAKSIGHPDLSIDTYDSNKGGLLKSTDFWMKPNVGANNSTYFNGLPAGLRDRDGKFEAIRKNSIFWSQSELNKFKYLVFSIRLSSEVTELSNEYNLEKSIGLSIRCIKDSSELQGNINSLECDSAAFSGQLLKDQSTIGANFKVPYSGGNGGTYNEQNVTSTGVSGLTATLKAGNFENGNGVLTYEVSGTPISSGVASFEINVGGKSCTIHQTVCGVIETIDSVQTCEKYPWKGKWLVTSGSYSDTIRSQNGCDTIQTLLLSIIPSQNRVESITACDPYVWYDSTYTESGTYTHTYQNAHGCTLTDTLVLLYSKPLNLVITGDSVVRVGDSIRWTSNLPGIWGLNSTYHVKIDSLGWIHGLNEGEAEVTLYVNSDLGCGNHLTKSLKVLPVIDPCSEVKNKVDSLFVCQSVEWNGALYNQSGVYAKTYQTSLGCSVTDTLVLNVYPSENKIDTLAVCGSTEWHGERYSVSGVYSKTYQNTYGCSVTDTLILEIKPSQNRVESITACDPYVWYDSTYTESGTYTHTYQNVHGCTLTDTLVLLYSKPLNLVISGDSVVRVGDSIRWTSNLSGIWGLNSTYHAKIDSLGWIHGLNEGEAEVTLYVNSDLGCGNHLTKSLKVLPAIDLCKDFYAVVSSFEDNTSDSSNCNGKIQIEQKGGKLPVSYLWNTGLTKPIGESLCEGDYLITLTDANLCSTVLKTTISKISTKETKLDIEVTTKNASSIQSCDGSVTINVKNGTAPFYFDNVISSTYSRNSLCAGLYTVEVSDAKGLKSTLPYLISAPETTINTENKLLKDSTSVDTIKTTLLKNCDIDLTKVDSVKIKEYLPIDNSMVVITWGIYSKNTTQFVTQKYKIDKGSGVYTALLEMYCKEEKRQIPSLQVAEKFYFRSTGNSTASVTQKEHLNNLRVYPNPFTDEVEIGLDYPQDFQLEIIGVDGHTLLIEKYTNQKTVRLNLGELANGVYLVKVSNSNFIQEKMIIK